MTLKEGIEIFQNTIAQELAEAKILISKGDKNAIWHWDNKDKQPASLDSSLHFFLSKYPNMKEWTEDNISHFCGQEIYDLWNGYKDDNIQNRQNHCAALYSHIKDQVSQPQL